MSSDDLATAAPPPSAGGWPCQFPGAGHASLSGQESHGFELVEPSWIWEVWQQEQHKMKPLLDGFKPLHPCSFICFQQFGDKQIMIANNNPWGLNSLDRMALERAKIPMILNFMSHNKLLPINNHQLLGFRLNGQSPISVDIHLTTRPCYVWMYERTYESMNASLHIYNTTCMYKNAYNIQSYIDIWIYIRHTIYLPHRPTQVKVTMQGNHPTWHLLEKPLSQVCHNHSQPSARLCGCQTKRNRGAFNRINRNPQRNRGSFLGTSPTTGKLFLRIVFIVEILLVLVKNWFWDTLTWGWIFDYHLIPTSWWLNQRPGKLQAVIKNPNIWVFSINIFTISRHPSIQLRPHSVGPITEAECIWHIFWHTFMSKILHKRWTFWKKKQKA